MSKKATYRPMTDAEATLALALGRCRFSPGTFSKRFARDISGGTLARREISEKQAACLRRMVTTFRRQILPETIAESERYLLTEEHWKKTRATPVAAEDVG